MNSYSNNKIQETEIKIVSVYLILIATILYLIFFYKEHASAIDEVYGTDYESHYPNTDSYFQIMAVLLLIGQGILLYYSYLDLQRDIESYNRTGHPVDIQASYNYFYFKLFTVTGIAILLYTAFFVDVNDTTYA